MTQTIAVERTVWIAVPAERVWQAVTEPEHLKHWYASSYQWEIPSLEVGGAAKFYNKDDEADIQLATIEVCEPPRQFTLRWQPDRLYPEVTLVTTFMLEEEDGGTRVTITESGYEALSADECRKWLDVTGRGYALSMENLKAYLEGRSVPF